MSVYLRRGRTTDAVFDHAVHATSFYQSFEDGIITERARSITIEQARRLFDEHKRSRMSKRGDGAFFFVIGTQWSIERIEIA